MFGLSRNKCLIGDNYNPLQRIQSVKNMKVQSLRFHNAAKADVVVLECWSVVVPAHRAQVVCEVVQTTAANHLDTAG